MLLWEQVLLLTSKEDHVSIERLMKEFFYAVGESQILSFEAKIQMYIIVGPKMH